ncbi:MAG: DNA translocase FtsK [Saprospiraceae bacterium]
MKKSTRKKRGATVMDDRIRKIAGFTILALATFLGLAFISYLFTWKVDQAAAMSYGWGLLFANGVEVANWMGPFGASVSHTAFYAGFGATSFLAVYLLALVGLAILKRRPLIQLQRQLRWGLFGLLVLSVMLAFLFQMIDFPMGGAYGYLISSWLERMIGIPGVVLLFALALVMLVIWIFDPSWSDVTSGKFLSGVELAPALPSGLSKFVGRFTPEKVKPARKKKPLAKSEPDGEVEPSKGVAGLDYDNDDLLAAAPKGDALDLSLPSELEQRNIKKAKQLSLGADDIELNLAPTPNEDAIDPALDAISANVGEKPEGYGAVAGETPRDILSAEAESDLESQGPYDPKLELSTYKYPTLELLKDYPDNENPVTREELNENKRQIVDALLSFGLSIVSITATVGPTITLYEIVPAPGVRISKIRTLSDDIALNLSALGIRIIAPIPGRGSIGIEVPNKNRQMVPLREVLASKKFREAKMELPIALGKTISNETMVVDLAKMPHLLVAGATGQGKSVGINTIIMSMLYRKHPSEVKLVMVDPKKVELSLYSVLERHFLTYMPGQEETIITENTKVIHTLNSLCIEMDQRYELLKKASVRHITEYNAKFKERKLNPKDGHKFLPYIVMIIDEFADLIMTAGKEVELPIARIAQLARAVGMHLIIATQRPTVKIITGTIKANFPARLAFKVTSGTDSKTILDGPGAEQLIGMGDMLLSMGAEKVRLQCAFVDTPEVNDVLDFISAQQGLHMPYLLPEYVGEDEEARGNSVLNPKEADELLRDAAHMVVDNHIGSTSMLQRRMKIGFNRAGRIMDELCQLGIVGETRGSKPREVMVGDILELESMLDLFYSGE